VGSFFASTAQLRRAFYSIDRTLAGRSPYLKPLRLAQDYFAQRIAKQPVAV
jgi:hypothetical protein